MTTVYIIINNYRLNREIKYKKELSLEQRKELLPLNFKGEKTASLLLKNPEILKTKNIYSSSYIACIETAKYLSEELNIPIYIDERLNERKVGILGNNTERFLKETQEHDFDYKLHNGESINMVLNRLKTAMKDILFHCEDETVTVFTHDIVTESLFTLWCEKGFNLENQMILNYKDEVIIDGAYHQFRIFKLLFEGDRLKEMSWENKEEL